MLARLGRAQSSTQTSLSRLDSDLAEVENALLSTRKNVWVRSGVVWVLVTFKRAISSNLGDNSAFLASTFLAFLFLPSRRSPQAFVPIIPLPIATVLIIVRELRISAVKATRARIEQLGASVASSGPVSANDITWLEGSMVDID